MIRSSKSHLAVLTLLGALLLFMPTDLLCQSPDSFLTRLDLAHLDSLAARTAQKIRASNLAEKEPSVLVMDFFRNSPGIYSRLGTLLADRFSESLTGYATGMKVLDRKLFKDYLVENWTTLEDLGSNEICLRIARQLGATGAILGTLAEEDGKLKLAIRLEGFGPTEKEDDLFPLRDRTVIIPIIEEIHNMLFQPAPNYARKADDIPEEPGVFRAGYSGVSSPVCTRCPAPDFPDAARVAKYQGTVLLSVVVTPEGQATSILVLNGAPFGLTAQAINATQEWRFRPGLKDGKPVSVRVQLETTFRLN